MTTPESDEESLPDLIPRPKPDCLHETDDQTTTPADDARMHPSYSSIIKELVKKEEGSSQGPKKITLVSGDKVWHGELEYPKTYIEGDNRPLDKILEQYK